MAMSLGPVDRFCLCFCRMQHTIGVIFDDIIFDRHAYKSDGITAIQSPLADQALNRALSAFNPSS